MLFFEDGNLAQIGVYELDPLECGLSILVCTLGSRDQSGSESASGTGVAGSPPPKHQAQAQAQAQHASSSEEYFVVGTAHVINGENEPSRGRILLFAIDREARQVRLIAEKEVRGGVYSLAEVHGRLLAGIGSKVGTGFVFVGSLPNTFYH